MQYLAIIRHGEFIKGELKLSPEGRRQIRKLVPLLKDLNPVVYSSIGPRSIESANLLAGEFGIESKAFEFFGSNARLGESNYYPIAFSFLTKTIENVVVVTKGE